MLLKRISRWELVDDRFLMMSFSAPPSTALRLLSSSFKGGGHERSERWWCSERLTLFNHFILLHIVFASLGSKLLFPNKLPYV